MQGNWHVHIFNFSNEIETLESFTRSCLSVPFFCPVLLFIIPFTSKILQIDTEFQRVPPRKFYQPVGPSAFTIINHLMIIYVKHCIPLVLHNIIIIEEIFVPASVHFYFVSSDEFYAVFFFLVKSKYNINKCTQQYLSIVERDIFMHLMSNELFMNRLVNSIN